MLGCSLRCLSTGRVRLRCWFGLSLWRWQVCSPVPFAGLRLCCGLALALALPGLLVGLGSILSRGLSWSAVSPGAWAAPRASRPFDPPPGGSRAPVLASCGPDLRSLTLAPVGLVPIPSPCCRCCPPAGAGSPASVWRLPAVAICHTLSLSRCAGH